MGEVLLNTSDLLFTVLIILILARVILTWLPQFRDSQFGLMVMNLSEPIMRPFQNLIPPMGMMDFSPMIAMIVLGILQQVVHTLIQAAFNL